MINYVSDNETPAASRRTFLSLSTAAAAVTATAGTGVALSATSAAADEKGWPDGPGRPITKQAPDAELRAILREINQKNIEAIIRKLVSFGTRHTLSSQTDPNRGIGAAANWILSEFTKYAAASGGRMTVQMQSYIQEPASRIPVATRINNPMATLRGSATPDRIYVVSGHYDSRVSDVMNAEDDSPGANDDASGVAVVMELARIMAKRRPDATIVFTAVAGEEQGLYGARHQAAQYKSAGADIQAMFTNDIVGSSTADDGARDPRSVRLFAEGVPTAETPEEAATRVSVGGENDSPARQLARFVSSVADNDATGMNIRTIYRRDRFLRGGDHIGYLEQGYPAARFTEPNENYAHQHQDIRVEDGLQYGDLPEFCDFAYIARVAKVNAAALWSLATAPGTPKNVTVSTNALTNDTDLSWDRSPEPDLAGYEVVWRETSVPDWTHVIPVGNVTEVRVDLSKDNAFFGVRAVDRAGHRSPVAFPVPD